MSSGKSGLNRRFSLGDTSASKINKRSSTPPITTSVGSGRYFIPPTHKSQVQIISSLKSHAHILESEIAQIENDMSIHQKMMKKYGSEGLRQGEKRLAFLKEQKEDSKAKVLAQLEKVEKALKGSQKLAKDLERLQLQEQLRELQSANQKKTKHNRLLTSVYSLEDELEYESEKSRLEEDSGDRKTKGVPHIKSKRSSLTDMKFDHGDPLSLQEKLEASSPILSNRSKSSFDRRAR